MITTWVQHLGGGEVRFFDNEKPTRFEQRTELVQHRLTLPVVDQHVPAMRQIELSVKRDIEEISLDGSVSRRRQVLNVVRLDVDRDDLAPIADGLTHPFCDRTGAGPNLQTTPSLADTCALESCKGSLIEGPLNQSQSCQLPIVLILIEDVRTHAALPYGDHLNFPAATSDREMFPAGQDTSPESRT